MEKVTIKDKTYNLEDKDAALVEAIKALTEQIRRSIDNGR